MHAQFLHPLGHWFSSDIVCIAVAQVPSLPHRVCALLPLSPTSRSFCVFFALLGLGLVPVLHRLSALPICPRRIHISSLIGEYRLLCLRSGFWSNRCSEMRLVLSAKYTGLYPERALNTEFEGQSEPVFHHEVFVMQRCMWASCGVYVGPQASF